MRIYSIVDIYIYIQIYILYVFVCVSCGECCKNAISHIKLESQVKS